ncbi:hypothetical protein DL93DRAFT_2085236 [Clavulina sp. PMI_390]|nr:hypothetical protein DL93DRAFT_2085236 [Clavulina sp. PMI_390]
MNVLGDEAVGASILRSAPSLQSLRLVSPAKASGSPASFRMDPNEDIPSQLCHILEPHLALCASPHAGVGVSNGCSYAAYCCPLDTLTLSKSLVGDFTSWYEARIGKFVVIDDPMDPRDSLMSI